MKYLKFLFILIIAVLLVGCWSTSEKNIESSNTNTEKTATSENPDSTNTDADIDENSQNADDKEDSKKVDTKRKPNEEMSPTEALKEFDDATNAKDFERIKKVLTKDSIEYFESEAKKQGMTFKQLVERPSEMPTVETPEMRNEKINGDKATVEAKNRFLGTFDKYPLVKEDGVWKVAYDVYLKQKLEEINKGVKP